MMDFSVLQLLTNAKIVKSNFDPASIHCSHFIICPLFVQDSILVFSVE